VSRELRPVVATKLPRSLSELSLDDSERGEWPAADLPDGWQWVEFDDLFDDITDSRRKLPTKDYQKSGRFPIVDQGEALIAGYSDREDMAQTWAPPYIIFGDHTKCIKLIETRFVQGADGVKVLRAKGGFEIKYLRYALIAVRLPDKGYSRHMKFLRATVFPACSLPEQRRVVAKLDTLTCRTARAREELGIIPKLIQRYREAILAAVFSGELTKQITSAAKRSWGSARIDTIASVGTGATPKRGTRRYYEGGTIPWVTSAAANQPFIDNADEFITEAALEETYCKVFPAGTLLLAMYGEGKTRGRVATLRIAAATNQALAAILVKPDGLVLPDFLIWFLRAQYFQLREKAAGGVQPNLNLGIVKSLMLPVPPRHEQAEIIRHIETAFVWLDRIIAEHGNASRLLPRLDQAILAKAFRGELVPQDPNDKPLELSTTPAAEARAAVVA
jgi:Type I restriction modification DNA specificity domain